MTSTLVVEFTKMSGAGNDFIVIDNRFYHFSDDELARIAKKWCPRRTAVGADGLLALSPSQKADFRMLYFNADGSRGSMCGNGARCLVLFATLAGISPAVLVFESDAGMYEARVTGHTTVRLSVPAPREFHEDIPVPQSSGYSNGTRIWTGTEHLVVFVPSVEGVDIERSGPIMRHAPVLGEAGANVDFVEVLGDDALRVRTWEKGVEAETLACGTGALASALVAAQAARVSGSPIAVHMPGGTLQVHLEGSLMHPEYIALEGEARVVYRGTLDLVL
ncbi:MAG: diaminopimelate epimerase [Bacteroidetes bacterium CG12_big_fil_rev_8_21_14_0_65_60_17]|nr:MAG: diaminopimelate epimerase [Bacteroidetes bacterium CG12_big_fil_rev_8_21_14_0_65_60_17]